MKRNTSMTLIDPFVVPKADVFQQDSSNYLSSRNVCYSRTFFVTSGCHGNLYVVIGICFICISECKGFSIISAIFVTY